LEDDQVLSGRGAHPAALRVVSSKPAVAGGRSRKPDRNRVASSQCWTTDQPSSQSDRRGNPTPRAAPAQHGPGTVGAGKHGPWRGAAPANPPGSCRQIRRQACHLLAFSSFFFGCACANANQSRLALGASVGRRRRTTLDKPRNARLRAVRDTLGHHAECSSEETPGRFPTRRLTILGGNMCMGLVGRTDSDLLFLANHRSGPSPDYNPMVSRVGADVPQNFPFALKICPGTKKTGESWFQRRGGGRLNRRDDFHPYSDAVKLLVKPVGSTFPRMARNLSLSNGPASNRRAGFLSDVPSEFEKGATWGGPALSFQLSDC